MFSKSSSDGKYENLQKTVYFVLIRTTLVEIKFVVYFLLLGARFIAHVTELLLYFVVGFDWLN